MTTSTALEQLAALALEASAPRLAEDARALAARGAEGRFHVACVGQFKRGKSTLLDALIGDSVLPTGVVPVTSVPTVVRHGARSAARVRDEGGSWHEIPVGGLAHYVSEEHNPENEKGITAVEVFVPAPFLATGLCLVDTPGLGSPMPGNTEATRAFVPHIDAAIVVLGADPPLSGEELDLIETLGRVVPDLLFVLNKADRVSRTECSEATAFARRILERRLRRQVGPIHEVSAAERLAGTGPPRDWGTFVAALEALAERSGRALVSAALRRGLDRIAWQLRARLDAERAALVRPLEESERHMTLLERTLSDAECSLADLAHLFAAESARLARSFAERRAAFLARTGATAHAELAASLRAVHERWGPARRRSAMALAQEVARAKLLPWLDAEQRSAEVAVSGANERFVALANEMLARMARSGAPELAPHAPELQHDRGLAGRPRFHYHDLIRVARPASPLRLAADALLVALGVTRPIATDAASFLDSLLEVNGARVESDLTERMRESARQLEADVRSLLAEVRDSAARALARAAAVRAEGAAAVEREMTRIARLERALNEIAPRATSPTGPPQGHSPAGPAPRLGGRPATSP